MLQIKQYILTVITAGVLCGILDKLSAGKTTAPVMKLICGIFMTFVVISPFRNIELISMPAISQAWLEEGRDAAAEGEDMAMESYSAIIKDRTEAYILDKAKTLDAILTVEVILDDDAIPVGVRLQGSISPYGKSVLTAMLEEDLGIAKEAQEWIAGN